MRSRKAYTSLKMILAFVLTAVMLVTAQGTTVKHIEAAPDTIVNIPDVNFKAILNDALGVSDPTADITAAQLATITTINAQRNKDLKDLTGIEYCTSLKTLRLEYCYSVEDLSPIYGLTSITDLDIEQISWTEDTKPNSLLAIASLVNLESFSAPFCELTDADMYIFDGKTKIKRLVLGMNEITDGSFLVKHKDTLKQLTLCGCSDYDDVTSIKQLTNLEVLGISGTYITDYSFISSLPNLTDNSMRWAEWSESFTTTTRNYVDVFISNEQPTFTYDNVVRDKNGNLLAPVESDGYTYDASTGKITIVKDPETFGNKVVYNLNTTAMNGDKLYAKHNTRITNCKITIYNQPKNKTIENGNSLNLYVNAGSRKDDLSYQWYKDGNAIDGATSSVLTIGKASKADAGSYYVVIKNSLGSTKSNSANVTVYIPLSITEQPSGVTVNEGDSSSISVTAVGENPGYQWYKDGNAIEGATSSSYTIESASMADAGNYYVVVTDENDSVKSRTVAVNVKKMEVPTTEATTEETTEATTEETTEVTTEETTEVTTEETTEATTEETTEATTEETTEETTEVTTEAETTIEAETEANTMAGDATTEAETTAADTTAANITNPETGDGSLGIVYILLIMLSLMMIIVTANNYRRREN